MPKLHVIREEEIERLRNGELYEYEGDSYELVESYRQGGHRYLVLSSIYTNKKLVFRLVEEYGNRMDSVDKRRYKKNIEVHVANMERARLISLARSYYHNFARINCYCPEDIAEVMAKFPEDVLLEAGLVFADGKLKEVEP